MPPTLSTAPLIPLPPGSPARPSDPNHPFDDLFGRPTPSASKPRPRPPTPPPLSATSSDFGDFVSVPASEDPLAASLSVAGPPPDPTQQGAPLGGDLLDELLRHEDDPMYFHRAGSSTPQPPASTTPEPPPAPSAPTPQPIKDVERPRHARQASASVLAHIQQLADAPFDLLRDLSEASLTPLDGPPAPALAPQQQSQLKSQAHQPTRPTRPAVPTSVDSAENGRRTPHARAHDENARHADHVHAKQTSLSSSSSTPPLRSSDPTAVPVHSTVAPALSTPSRWMSTLFSRVPSTTSARHPHPEHAATMPASLGRASASGAGLGLTHGTPFAPHTFVPASGAPGFAGDGGWDTKGFIAEFEREDDGAGAGAKKGVVLSGRSAGTAGVLGVELAEQIRPSLPALARLPSTWRLLYSLDQHGVSLQTLYARCGAHAGGTVLAVLDARGCVFGAWLAEGIKFGQGETYFGSGESFLWRSRTPSSPNDGVDVFRWTGKNDYVALCERAYLALGGGDGTFGLYLDAGLLEGSSARCPTFENEVLCARPPDGAKGRTVGFECVGVEVWAVGG